MPIRDVCKLFPHFTGAGCSPKQFFEMLQLSSLPCECKCSLFLDLLEMKSIPAEPPVDHLLYVLAGVQNLNGKVLDDIDAAFPFP